MSPFVELLVSEFILYTTMSQRAHNVEVTSLRRFVPAGRISCMFERKGSKTIRNWIVYGLQSTPYLHPLAHANVGLHF